MEILTYYDRQDDFKIDKAEWLSNKMLGFLRTAAGKKVIVRMDYQGQRQVSDPEYSSAKAKAAVIVLALLLLPLSVLAATIGILIHNFSSTYGKSLLSERKIEEKKQDSPPPPPSISISPKPNKSPELPNPPSHSPASKSPVKDKPESTSPLLSKSPAPKSPVKDKPESISPLLSNSPKSLSPKASPIPDLSYSRFEQPRIEVQFNKNEYVRVNEEEFINLIQARGSEIDSLHIENTTTISLSALLPFVPNIEVLIFKNCRFGEEGLSGFKTNLKSLIKLRICECELTSEELKTLAEVRFIGLKHLDLSNNWIDDEGIPTLLSALTNCRLTLLDLSENQISSVGTKYIGRCESLYLLEDLYLLGNPLDDESIQHITKRCLSHLKNISIGLPEYLTIKGIKELLDWVKGENNRIIDYMTSNPFIPK